MANWRFDQGRLDYFQFDEIKKISKALAALDGIDKPANSDPDIIREMLSRYSDLPFLPDSYYVWRNYGRVFGVLLLAAEIQGKVFATDLCKQLSRNNEIDCDDYLAHFARNFYYNSPVFKGYNPFGHQIFPVVAIIKLLISRFLTQGVGSLSVADVHGFLIANNVDGTEDLGFYQSLVHHPVPNGGHARQVRELMIFISQFSFLTWQNPSLYLNVQSRDELLAIEQALAPIVNVMQNDPGAEVMQMGSGFLGQVMGPITLNQLELIDQEFTEGQRVRVTHLRTERNSKLKALYFAHVNHPQVCRMCAMDTAERYPWAEHVIELHHLLPLASPIRVESSRTSLRDLVGICPSCHRATHKYYSLWFRENHVHDFRSYEEAHHVYQDAKSRIILPTH